LRARKNWKLLQRKSRTSLRAIHTFRKATLDTKGLPFIGGLDISDGKMDPYKIHSLAAMLRAQVLEDDESRAEVYQTVMNSATARLKQMFEAQTITVTCYKLFLECLDHGEEAIAGELRPYGFLKSDPSRIYKQSHAYQMESCLDVVWESLKDHMTHDPQLSTRILNKLCPAKFYNSRLNMFIQWKRLQRDVELILSYVMIHEAQLEEISLYDDFPKIKTRLSILLARAKSSHLYGIQGQNTVLFAIFEHVLAMKIVVLTKQKVLEDFTQLGILKTEDFELICECILNPAMRQICNFIPSVDFLPDKEKPGNEKKLFERFNTTKPSER
jgi:hypothetical protein